MKKYKFTIHGNKYEVEIKDIDDGIAEIEVNGSTYTVEIEKTIQQPKTPKLMRSVVAPSTDSHSATVKTAKPDVPKGTGYIKSPLPGTILEVMVREGDTVKIGTKLLVLEAMKMENNINSDKEGKVISIKVRPGDAVMEGDMLIQIGE